MHVIRARNINDAYAQGLSFFANAEGKFPILPSRAGETIESPEPVSTVYQFPTERVLFAPIRDGNPFFHLFEALWMLTGRQDTHWLEQFSKQASGMLEPAASYGYRWRAHFERDQLEMISEMIIKDPMTRRAVLGIWDPRVDLGSTAKDIPCNDTVKFCARRGVLDMVVFNRSNDMIWGTYGANAVHFSVLQEYMASMTGLLVGTYTQISCNYHVYVELWNKKRGERIWPDHYVKKTAYVYPLVHNPTTFEQELNIFLDLGEPPARCGNMFLSEVADPIWESWRAWKEEDVDLALEKIDDCAAPDWRVACKDWYLRRLEKQS